MHASSILGGVQLVVSITDKDLGVLEDHRLKEELSQLYV